MACQTFELYQTIDANIQTCINDINTRIDADTLIKQQFGCPQQDDIFAQYYVNCYVEDQARQWLINKECILLEGDKQCLDQVSTLQVEIEECFETLLQEYTDLLKSDCNAKLDVGICYAETDTRFIQLNQSCIPEEQEYIPSEIVPTEPIRTAPVPNVSIELEEILEALPEEEVEIMAPTPAPLPEPEEPEEVERVITIEPIEEPIEEPIKENNEEPVIEPVEENNANKFVMSIFSLLIGITLAILF